jgi:ketose-bisphosphate aldolase
MKLLNSKILADHAQENGYGVPALNTNGATYDITRAIIEAAEEMRSPLIIQCYEPNLEYRGFNFFPQLVEILAGNSDIPVSIQLDHGKNETSIMKAVKAGFTSMMIDYAHLSVADNAAGTQRIIDLVRPLGISVEAEIGHIIKSSEEEGKKAPLVKVEEVKEFTDLVDVDLLAVAVGTTHGIFKEQTGINLDLISEIRASVDVPLVLHGTCGISLDLIQKCVSKGMTKINFGEVFRMNYIRYFNEVSSTLNHEQHAWKIMKECMEHLKKDIREIIEVLGSAGKADRI